MTSMQQEVELLFPQGKSIKVKGQDFVVKPYGFGQFPRVLKAIKALGDVMPDGATSAEIPELIAKGGDNVIELCSIAIKQPAAWFEDVPADEAIDLCSAIVEVNRDFFVKRLQPKMTAAVEKLSELVGAASSPA